MEHNILGLYYFNTQFMIVIEFIIYLFWSLMGLFFWIPILTRVAFTFVGKIFYDTVSGKPTDVVYINKLITVSAEFYLIGFKLINQRFKKLSGIGAQPIYDDVKTPFFSHAKNIVWTIIFWSLVLFPLYKDVILPK